MASLADDSSVDENVSSVGGSTWDMVDDASAASEDDGGLTSRVANPKSDSIESLHLDNKSFSAEKSSTNLEKDRDPQPWKFEKIGRFDLQEAGGSSKASSSRHSPEASYSAKAAEAGSLKFEEILKVDSETGIKYARAALVDLKPDQQSQAQSSDIESPTTGSISLGMKDGGLVVSDTLKLLYIGPREMKPLITQKMGSAIAANPRRLSLKDGLDHSRVTVVPVSALFDDSNPEVVMIESGGFDMSIEECINAFPSNYNSSGTLIMELDSQKTLRSTMDSKSNSCRLSPSNSAPDLAVIYQPQTQSSESDLTSYWAEAFLKRHNVPYYFISHDGSWSDPSLAAFECVDDEVPHRRLEAIVDGSLTTLKRLPINVSNFLAIDASQLHHNIVALKAKAAQRTAQKKPNAEAIWMVISAWLRTIQKRWQAVPAPILLKFVLPSITVAIMLLSVLIARSFVASQASSPDSGVFSSSSVYQVHQAVTTPPVQPISASKSLIPSQLDAYLSASSLAVIHNQRNSEEQVTGSQRRKGTLVQLIGESHVFIRPAVAVKASHITFKAMRDNKPIPCSLQNFDGEYYVLQVPDADAFGLVTIEMRSSGRPKFHETLQVDLGSPWLKPKHWQELAQSFSEQTMKQVTHLSEQLQESIFAGSIAEQFKNQSLLEQFQDGAATVLLEVERLSNWSSATIAEQRKANPQRIRRLSKMARRLRRQGLKKSANMKKEYQKLMQSANKVSRKMTKMVHSELRGLEKTLKQMDREYRRGAGQSKFIRRAQKKLLHAWWNVRGRPANRPR